MNNSPLYLLHPDSPGYRGNTETDSENCPLCESDRTTYSNCVDGVEIRKCWDCNEYYEVENE